MYHTAHSVCCFLSLSHRSLKQCRSTDASMVAEKSKSTSQSMNLTSTQRCNGSILLNCFFWWPDVQAVLFETLHVCNQWQVSRDFRFCIFTLTKHPHWSWICPGIMCWIDRSEDQHANYVWIASKVVDSAGVLGMIIFIFLFHWFWWFVFVGVYSCQRHFVDKLL